MYNITTADSTEATNQQTLTLTVTDSHEDVVFSRPGQSVMSLPDKQSDFLQES